MFCNVFELKWLHETWVKGHAGQRCSQTWCPQWRGFRQRPCCSEGRSAALMRSAAAVCSSSGPEDSSRCRNWLGGETPVSCDGSRGRHYEFRRGKMFLSSLIWEFCVWDEFTQTHLTRQGDGWRRCCSRSVTHCYINTVYYHYIITMGWFIWCICIPLTAITNYY